MPLPKIATPTYELELPSTGQTITYRPFLVKEEKVLVIALESEDTKQITNAIKSVIKNCITTRGIKVEQLPTFDIEYLFLNIRGKSVGEEIDVNIICPDDEETQVSVKIDLDDIEVVKNKEHSSQIRIDKKIMMEMKYPSLDQFIKNNFDFADNSAMDQSFELIASCIDKIYTEDDVWVAADCTKKEVNEFLESMNSSQFKDIEKFFETMPKLSHTVKVTNPNTKVESEVVLEGLASFFRVAMIHMDLISYFKLNFALMQYHKYSLTEIENMMPWERDIYVGLLQQHLEEEKLKQQQSRMDLDDLLKSIREEEGKGGKIVPAKFLGEDRYEKYKRLNLLHKDPLVERTHSTRKKRRIQ